MTTPKFEIGTIVNHKADLYGMTQSTIVKVEKVFREVDPRTGEIDPRGLTTLEHTIEHTSLPYEFDGETLTVHFPERVYSGFVEPARVMTSKFSGYSYTTRNEKMSTIWSERALRVA